MNALTITSKQTDFLAQKRKDPITGDEFLVGDEVVFCATCKSAFSVDSWEYMGGVHCGQKSVLRKFPDSFTLKLYPPTIPSGYVKADALDRLGSAVFDASILIVISVVPPMAFDANFGLSLGWFILCFFILWVFRDAILRNKSIGKAALRLCYIDIKTRKKASFWKTLLRPLLFWGSNTMFVVALISSFSELVFACMGLANISSLTYLILYKKSLSDKLLGIRLVQKK